MATNNWLSRALAVAQVETITVTGPIVAAETFSVIINGKYITFTATTTTVAHVVTGLLALLQAETAAELTEITWTSPTSSTIVGTANTAGLPFVVSTEDTSAAGSIATSTTTAATGPNHADNVNNWSNGAAPANGDNVYIDLDRGSILYGLDLSGVTVATLDVYSAAQTEGKIGLPQVNESGNYYEYRERYLKIGATIARIQSQSSRVNINYGSVQTATEVRETGSETNGIPALLLKGTSTSNVFEFKAGTSGLAFHLDETAAAATVRVSPQATLICGPACTLTAVTSLGETLIQTVTGGATTATLTVEDGETKVIGTGAVTTLNVDGGTCKYESSGTVTTATITGTVDCSEDISPRTFTNTNIEPGGVIIDPNQTITHTNGIARTARVKQVTAA